MPERFKRYQLRLLLLSRKRVFTDTIVCSLMFLLIIGFTMITLWHRYETNAPEHDYSTFIDYLFKTHNSTSSWIDAFSVIVSTSVIFLAILMTTAYVNLFVIKTLTLDRTKIKRTWRYGLYILSLLIVTALFTVFWYNLNQTFNKHRTILWIRLDLGPYVSFIAQFAFSIAATGLVYLRELNKKSRKLDFLNNSKQRLIEKLQHTQEKFEAIQLKLDKAENKLSEIENVQTLLDTASDDIQNLDLSEVDEQDFSTGDDHIKIGESKNYRLFKYQELLYIEANNNNCLVYLVDGTFEKIKGKPLWRYRKHLPEKLFLKISRKHIIASQHVVGRNGKYFILKTSLGKDILLKIGGDSFEKEIDEHDYLGF